MNPAEVAGLNVAASEAPRVESRTRKSEAAEFQTGTSVPAINVVSRGPSCSVAGLLTQEAGHVCCVLQGHAADTIR